MQAIDIARRVLREEFGVDSPDSLEHVPQGRVNLTFSFRNGPEKYILQRIHPAFGQDGVVIENTAAAAESLAAAGLPAPRVQRTLVNGLWAEDHGLWRLTARLSGEVTGQRSQRAGREAARFLGMFHRALAEHTPQLEFLPPTGHFRDGPASTGLWAALIDGYRGSDKLESAASILSRGRRMAEDLPEFEPSTKAFVHGDPKLENFLFDDRGKAVGLIDLDTVRRGFLLWELADGLRSWAGIRTPSDDLVWDVDIFLSSVGSYQKNGLKMTREEWTALPVAVRAVTLNLARRYMTDYFEESYFAWDQDRYPSLAEQNYRRGAGYLDLAEEMADGEAALISAIDRCRAEFIDNCPVS